MSLVLTRFTQTAFYALAAAGFSLAAASLFEVYRFVKWVETSPSRERQNLLRLRQLADAEELSIALISLVGVLHIALLISSIVWLYKARKAADRFGGLGTKWSPGWAIGGWFIPLGFVVIPKLVFNEVERLSNPELGPAPITSGWTGVRTAARGWIYWIGLVVGSVTIRGGIVMRNSAGGESFVFSISAGREYEAGIYVVAAGSAVLAVACIAGAMTLGMLHRQLNR